MAGMDVWDSRLNWETWNGDLPFWQHALCGSIAGVAEHLFLFPLDTIKTRLQTSNLSLYHIAWNNKVPFGGLFRGTQAIVIGCIPAHISYFTLYEFISKWNVNSQSKINGLGANASESNSNNKPKLAHIARDIPTTAMAGAIATIAHDIMLVPADMMKQRLQLGCYKSLFHCLKCVIKEEGSCAFYRSFPTTLFMNIPFHAILVAANEYIKRNFDLNSKNNLPLFSGYFISAGLGGALAALVTNPLDVIKTKIQTQTFNGKIDKKNNTIFTIPFNVAKNIYKIAGFSGFMRGCMARIAICTPAAAISWGTYESIKMIIS